MIEAAYTTAETQGLAVWTADQAEPFQTRPYPGSSWRPQEHPVRLSHEYIRDGTAKVLTLFHRPLRRRQTAVEQWLHT